MSKVKNFGSSTVFFLGLVVVALLIVINSMIGGFGWKDLLWSAISAVRLQVVFDYSQLSDFTGRLQLYRMVSER